MEVGRGKLTWPKEFREQLWYQDSYPYLQEYKPMLAFLHPLPFLVFMFPEPTVSITQGST